jgi:hypothetical protein
MSSNYNDGKVRIRLEIWYPKISGQSVPLSGLPRPKAAEPLRRSDGVNPDPFRILPSPTNGYSPGRYPDIRNSEVSFPLHTENDLRFGTPIVPDSLLPFSTDGSGLQLLKVLLKLK